MHVGTLLNTTTAVTNWVPRTGVQDFSPSLLLSVNQSQHVSSIQKPHCGLGHDRWWAKWQSSVLWKAETLHTQSSKRPDIESRVSEQRTASCTSDAQQGFRRCTMWSRWVAEINRRALCDAVLFFNNTVDWVQSTLHFRYNVWNKTMLMWLYN